MSATRTNALPAKTTPVQPADLLLLAGDSEDVDPTLGARTKAVAAALLPVAAHTQGADTVTETPDRNWLTAAERARLADTRTGAEIDAAIAAGVAAQAATAGALPTYTAATLPDPGATPGRLALYDAGGGGVALIAAFAGAWRLAAFAGTVAAPVVDLGVAIAVDGDYAAPPE